MNFCLIFHEIPVCKQKTGDGTLRFAASHLGLYSVHMSHKKTAA